MSKPPLLTPEQENEVLDLWASGTKSTAIARQFHLPDPRYVSTIARKARRRGDPRAIQRPSAIELNPTHLGDQRETILGLMKAGLLPVEIAGQIGRPHGVVRDAVMHIRSKARKQAEAAGEELEPYRKRTMGPHQPETIEQVLDLWAKGMPTYAMARLTGLSENAVRSMVFRHKPDECRKAKRGPRPGRVDERRDSSRFRVTRGWGEWPDLIILTPLPEVAAAPKDRRACNELALDLWGAGTNTTVIMARTGLGRDVIHGVIRRARALGDRRAQPRMPGQKGPVVVPLEADALSEAPEWKDRAVSIEPHDTRSFVPPEGEHVVGLDEDEVSDDRGVSDPEPVALDPPHEPEPISLTVPGDAEAHEAVEETPPQEPVPQDRQAHFDRVLDLWSQGVKLRVIAETIGRTMAFVYRAIQEGRAVGDPRAERRNATKSVREQAATRAPQPGADAMGLPAPAGAPVEAPYELLPASLSVPKPKTSLDDVERRLAEEEAALPKTTRPAIIGQERKALPEWEPFEMSLRSQPKPRSQPKRREDEAIAIKPEVNDNARDLPPYGQRLVTQLRMGDKVVEGDCRFPTEERPRGEQRFRFCGRPTTPGYMYCAHHALRVFDWRGSFDEKERLLRLCKAEEEGQLVFCEAAE